ncbi:hypothetical protein AVE30378_01289 [Achromobacter veterisilvae]|uniref:Acyclic terpene utilisation N-terminal domain-containing protein n=1 Tax=Achromobacter veterisilvae TaxID=2069367 RepID=A0A446CAJ5_9BURK|nr:acyclic terpene utilization AtuA family protein [Achromobacter veterisilvae]SSW64854.1 hypothetical protein AVE30378_01289 [Achromobacter veterisilvae]
MKDPRTRLRVGVGAGMADDRVGPAIALLEQCELDYLVCECLAERTIARETLARQHDDKLGFNPMLAERMRSFLPLCREKGVRLVSNMGAANPVGAAQAALAIGRSLGWQDLKCAAIVGDDVADRLRGHPELQLRERKLPLEEILPRLASANAYLGADTVRDALATGAHVVLSGRVADPSLFLGVAMHHHGWAHDDLPRMAAGTIMGHLLECSAQVTGGYFADPGRKEVPRLAELPYPYADIYGDGELHIAKPDGSGGRLDRMTCTEQALYEIHDPRAYITPDCVLSLDGLSFEELTPDRVAVRGANARARTDTYKVVVGYADGWIGAGEVAYAGLNAVARAQLAARIVQERFRLDGGTASEFQVDLIGMSSLHGDRPRASSEDPYEVRLRIAARCPDKKSAHLLGDHVRQLNMQGPYGAGGPVNLGAKEVIAVDSVLIPRNWVTPQVITVGA